MGCSNSKEEEKVLKPIASSIGLTERLPPGALQQKKIPEEKKDRKVKPRLENGRLTEADIEKRTSGSKNTAEIKIGDKIIRYACMSQRGYYPNHISKANQDDYVVVNSLGGEEGASLFCVFDGHGEYGEQCAEFTRDRLPRSLNKFSRQCRIAEAKTEAEERGEKFVFNSSVFPGLTAETAKDIFKKSYLETDERMDQDKTIRDHFSGTTAVSALFIQNGTKICVANVGDSRAIFVTKVDVAMSQDETEKEENNDDPQSSTPSSFVFEPITTDHTPFDKAEADRVRGYGSVIKTIQQQTRNLPEPTEPWETDEINLTGNIPRVYKKYQMYPGTAFTRSIGDRKADPCGVIADPDVFMKDIPQSDSVLVLASDGVFEFIRNVEVAKICMEHFEDEEGPLKASKKIVNMAYNRWLDHETRTDDITIICVFIQGSPGTMA